MVAEATMVLTVNILPITDSNHQHNQSIIMNLVNNPERTDPNPPEIFITPQFFHSRWARIARQVVGSFHDPNLHLLG